MSHIPDTHIEVEGDKPKVERTRKVLGKELRQMEAEREREQRADDRASRILFSIKCLRPTEKYPYEVAVFESELSVPVGADESARENAVAAWFKMMDAGVAVSEALIRERGGAG
jgi:hypothetical protein